MLITKLVTNFKHNRTAFTRFNLARDHAMTKDELRYALTHYHIHLDDAEFDKFVSEFDEDGNGTIDFREFISVVGAEVSGTQDNGLSVTMQAADDRQKKRLKDLHKELERHDFEHSESESESEIDEEGRHHHYHVHHHKGDRRLPEGQQYHTPADETFERPESQGSTAYHKCPIDGNLALVDAKARHSLQRAIKLANQEAVLGNELQVRPHIAAARRRRQALTRSQHFQGTPQNTAWTVTNNDFSPKQEKLHRRHWRNPPARRIHRALSEPLIVTHR